MVRFGGGEQDFLHLVTLKQLSEPQVLSWLEDTQDVLHGFALVLKRARSGFDGCHDIHKDDLPVNLAEGDFQKKG